MAHPDDSVDADHCADVPSCSDEVILKDGGSVLIRTLTGSDQYRIHAFFERLSPRSSRYRFFGAHRLPPMDEIVRLTSPDPGRSAGLAALTEVDGEERIVGIAEFAAKKGSTDSPRRAEFAVAVADNHQDRGIGTLLLERTAALAQRVGIDELEALVLGDDDRMLDVFERSGFELQRSGDREGKVVFPTARTEEFLAASLERERIAARESVRVFFEPRSVAVVGVSRRAGSIGRSILENLVKSGFSGPTFAVNRYLTEEVFGRPTFPSLTAIRQSVDLVIVAVPADRVEAVVAECAQVHARGVVIVSSGFGEASSEGRAREVRIKHMVRNAGMRLVGPNCMGVLNASPDVRLNATFAPVWPPAGNVSMLSQSGALGIAMLDHAAQLNVGISGFVSVGNRADVSVNDLLAYWADDPKTKVMVLYLESLGNARKFARLAPEVARRKPIVAVKSGRSAAGTRAAASHSAALASLDVGIDALFEQAGVIRTNTLEDLFDVVALLSTQPLPKGPRIGVVTNAGGPGILLADACEARGLTLPALSEATVRGLRKILPPQAGFSNPVDMISSATPEQYEQAMDLVGRDAAVDAVVAIYIPLLVTKPDDIACAIARGAARVPAEKPVTTVFMSAKGTPAALAEGARGPIPSYSFPENAALALSAAWNHARFEQRGRGKVTTLPKDRQRTIRTIVDTAIRGARGMEGWLSPADVTRLLELAGIPYAATTEVVAEPDAAAKASESVGYPVVLKAVATGLVHKSDAGGVAMGLASPEAVRLAANHMKQRVEKAGFLLQRFLLQREVPEGFEALVGVTTDRELGPILVAGLGGVQVELLGDVVFRLPPVSDLDARDMLDHLRARRLFDGFRGAPAGDRMALAEVICKVSALVDIAPEIAELDLNPIKVLPSGQGVVVVDARLRVRPARADYVGSAPPCRNMDSALSR